MLDLALINFFTTNKTRQFTLKISKVDKLAQTVGVFLSHLSMKRDLFIDSFHFAFFYHYYFIIVHF